MELEASIGIVRASRQEELPYAASWINRLSQWIDNWPGPAWCYYVGLVFVITGVQLALSGWEGSFRPGIIGFAAVITGSSVYYLAMIYYLDKVATDAFKRFRPSIAVTDRQASELCYRLTRLPERPVYMVTLFGLACALLMIAGTEMGFVNVDRYFFGRSAAVQSYWRAALIADQIMFWNLIYHTVHQLRVVNLIYTQYTKIDLFNLSPLYRFSRLTALTAIATLLIAYLWVATYPWLSHDFLVIGSWLIGIVAALAGFILPLLGIHRRLVEEKQQWQTEAGQWLKLSIGDFHQLIAERKLEDVERMLKVIEGVNREQAILAQIPTWPWQPGTIRGLATTIVVPILLSLVVQILDHLMNF